jgi:hypothetical protein
MHSGRHAGVVHRANVRALGCVEVTGALRAELGIDDVHAALHRDSCIGTLELASAAYGALRSNDLISHNDRPPFEVRGISDDAQGVATRLPTANSAYE